MRFYDIGESPLMGHSEKHIAPLVLGGIIAAVLLLLVMLLVHHLRIRLIRLILILIAKTMRLMPSKLRFSVIGKRKCGE